MSEPIAIGADHGYAAMKTAHFSFSTGLVELGCLIHKR